ncbi:MAG: RagB/SusD family nutrient uptake outer membrane protein [Flavobacterium sp. BFFFF2]|nr:MAG: RagB/SusD family nutrient uptake outer membrane protein [Flavobacterium sp. BFFFF2]
MKRYNKIILLAISILLFGSCTNLDVTPRYELTLENLLAQDPNAVNGLVSKMYGTFALTGPSGPGSSDISGPDAGETGFLRGIINLEDFTADAVKNRWGDDGLDQLTTTNSWTPSNKFFRYLFDRVYFTVPQCTQILKTLNSAGNIPNKDKYVAELRFLRSLAYFYMIDCFGKGVLVTTENYGSLDPLPEANRIQLFNYVESELLSVEQSISLTSDYGRVNKSVVRMLLAKLYLNAEVYIGQNRYADCITFVNKVITEGNYSLAPNYLLNFSADNNLSPEIIYPLLADSLNSQSYGNTTYIVNGSMSSDTMNISLFGATDGWTGHRSTKAWYGLYGDSAATIAANPDVRASLFWTTQHNYDMNDYKKWKDGYPSTKFRNTSALSVSGATRFSSTDFPMFRLADAYLMYAECVVRGAGGSIGQALQYVNAIRTRSNASTIVQSDLSLDFILDERARELNLEGHRRTDLIRFNKFTGNAYIWPWKGGAVNGTSIPDTYKLFPIPLTALGANPNITQNPGY